MVATPATRWPDLACLAEEWRCREARPEALHPCRLPLALPGRDLKPHQARDVDRAWNGTELNSFLVEITATVLGVTDPKTGRPLVEMIRDAARQKGTGAWTTASAAELQTPVPTIAGRPGGWS